MSTPHIEAKKGDIAKGVIMPGDPLRAKFIAENFLSNVRCYNTVRNMLGFTGEYKGKTVSVQGSGMGIPSMGIYSHELYSYYNVESIIRVGTAGAISDDVNLRDVVIAAGACTNSNYINQFDLPGDFSPIADFSLVRESVRVAEEMGISPRVGNVLSSDTFYDASNSLAKWEAMGVLAVEMEAAALYSNAAFLKKRALCILTISDTPLKPEITPTTSQEREKTFTDMMEIALSVI